MHTASYEFLIKPKESAGCHQTLSARVGSGDETTRPRPKIEINFWAGSGDEARSHLATLVPMHAQTPQEGITFRLYSNSSVQININRNGDSQSHTPEQTVTVPAPEVGLPT